MSAHDESTPARRLGRSRRWREASAAYLAEPGNERCAYCKLAAADVVDHAVAHRGDQVLFWSRSNWRPCCRACNSAKNVAEEGGFGRAPGTFTPRAKGCDANGLPLDPSHPWNVERAASGEPVQERTQLGPSARTQLRPQPRQAKGKPRDLNDFGEPGGWGF